MNALTEKTELKVLDTDEFNALMDSDRFNQMQRVGQMFSQSDLVPDVFKGKPPNCMVALQMAFRLKIDPLALMQSMYVVHGRPGLESKMLIALINTRGPFDGPIQWRFDGEGKTRSCTAYATHRRTKERCEQTVTQAMVDAEGWSGKPGSKWKTMPDIMFQYRSAAFLGRLYCPEVILGLSTADELQDMSEIVINPPPSPQAKKQVEMPRAKAESVDKETGEISAGVKIADDDWPDLDAAPGWKPPKDPPPPPPPAPEQTTQPLQRNQQPEGNPASISMKRIVRKKMENAALSEADFEKKFGKPFEAMLADEVNDAIAWTADPTA